MAQVIIIEGDEVFVLPGVDSGMAASIKKNRIAHNVGDRIFTRAAGYAMKTRAVPTTDQACICY